MPIEPAGTEARAPAGGHFALLVDESGQRLAIPAGASLWLVEDASQADKIFPMFLKKVSHKKLVFEMRQLDGSVTEYTYQLISGKPLNKAAYEKMLKNRNGAPVKVQR